MLREAIQNGICKVNLATEIKNTFMVAMKECLKNTNEIDLRIVFPYAIHALVELLENKLKTINRIS
jgi:fructose-bisphosphate aldolase class II/tagatose 1,6-diphosphate aldolase GatY/KbaY